MKCSKCDIEAELKVFSSFQYYYCSTCKEEVKETSSIPTMESLVGSKGWRGLEAWLPTPSPLILPPSNHTHSYTSQRTHTGVVSRCGCGHEQAPPSILAAPKPAEACLHLNTTHISGRNAFCTDCKLDLGSLRSNSAKTCLHESTKRIVKSNGCILHECRDCAYTTVFKNTCVHKGSFVVFMVSLNKNVRLCPSCQEDLPV